MDTSAGEPSEPVSAGILEDAMPALPHPVGDANGNREEKTVPKVPGAEVACTVDASAAGNELPRFMEWWFASISECISYEEFRAIRLRRATLEAARARLGGGPQGTMQLLKLLLKWVQLNHRVDVMEEAAGLHGANPGPGHEFPAGGQDMAAGGGTSLMPRRQQPWFTPPAYGGEAAVYPSATDQYQYHILHQSSSKNSVVVNSHPLSPGFGGQYDAGATSHPTKQKVPVPPSLEEAAAAKTTPGARQDDSPQRLAASDKRQGAKAEENLRFLLQKKLTQSDVGDLGRIVLPKMEAELHLPELKTKDGISIPMEDMETSRVWNMQYRFWSNNKSRMYVLGNTGEFVRSNELQKGDFIVIYSDVKSGKCLIRGVKGRPPEATTEVDLSEDDLEEVDLDTKVCDLVASARKSEVDLDEVDLGKKICDLVASARL